MNKIVVVLAFNRPVYLAACLDALSKCRGVEEYGVLISVDGGYGSMPRSQVKSLVEYFSNSLKIEYAFNSNNRGINWHNYHAFGAIFSQSAKIGQPVDFMVAVEDDCVLSADALELANWFYEHPRRDEYLCMSLGRVSKSLNDRVLADLVDEAPNLFSPHGWCFTRKQWGKMVPVWNSKQSAPIGWDWSLAYQMFKHGWKALVPQLSRTLNIGREGGVNCYPEWFDEHMAGQVVSDGGYGGPWVIREMLPDDWTLHPKDWMKEEMKHEANS